MATNFYLLRVNIHPDLFERMKQEVESDISHSKTYTSIVRDALGMYFRGTVVHSEQPILEKPDFHITAGSFVNPRENVTIRQLEAKGIKYMDIIKARRAKSHGREYDQSLEPYFSLV